MSFVDIVKDFLFDVVYAFCFVCISFVDTVDGFLFCLEKAFCFVDTVNGVLFDVGCLF